MSLRTGVATRCLLSASLSLGLAGAALGQDFEPNDSFFESEFVEDRFVSGQLGNGGFFVEPEMFGVDDFYESSFLDGDTFDFWSYGGLTPFRDFVVIIDNDPFGSSGSGYGYFSLAGASSADEDDIAGTGFGYGFGAPDTTLGLYEGSFLIDTDDDDSPLGDGLASAIYGQVSASGEINIAVSGYPDGLDGDPTPFDGFVDIGDGLLEGHGQFGDYYMYVIFDQTDPFDALSEFIPAGLFGDTDFFNFETPVPGVPYRATLQYSEFDAVMAAYDAFGNQVAFDDDSAYGEPVVDFIPLDSNFTLGVSAYPDDFLDGNHDSNGFYDLVYAMLGDFDFDDDVDELDIEQLFNSFGFGDSLTDIDLDGDVDDDDVDSLLLQVFNTVRGDANLDGSVDLIDLSLLASAFGDGGLWGSGDFNGDFVVDLIDLSILATNFGYDGTTPLPTPGTAAVLVPAAFAALRRRR